MTELEKYNLLPVRNPKKQATDNYHHNLRLLLKVASKHRGEMSLFQRKMWGLEPSSRPMDAVIPVKKSKP